MALERPHLHPLPSLDDGHSAALTTRLLTGNAVLAGLGLATLFAVLVSGQLRDATQTTATLMFAGVAWIPMLWVLTTSVMAARGKLDDPHHLLERQTVLIVAAVVVLTLARLVWLLGPAPEQIHWVHDLVGGQTLLVYYSGRLHAASSHPPSPRLAPIATVGLVASVVIELGVLVRLVFAPG